jgi:hypothetical protein
MTYRNLASLAFALLLASVAIDAAAQEPTYMDAATHPGAGQFYSRLLVSQSEYDEDATEIEELGAVLKLVYGIRPTLAVLAEGEVASLSANDHDETGLLSSTFQIKHRLFKRDLGPLNTWMASVFAGVTVPGDMDAAANADTYPRCALVSTAILGRHGMNGELEWEEYGSEPDRFIVNASHLYRLAPAEYAADTRGAWYTMVESLNQFTDDGDSRFDLAAGILYEARRWACEASLSVPLEQDWPKAEDYTVTLGVRYLP